jgi:DNA-binding transcriptional LysR family regulator
MTPKPCLNLLPIAVTLADTGNLTRAAEALGMSPAAVSMALRRLRAEFGDRLFIRTARGMVPTPQAERIVEKARPLLEQLQTRALLHERFDPATVRQAFSFALSDAGEMVFLPRLLARLRAEAPDAPVRSLSMPPADIASGMERGTVDLALGFFPDLRQSHFFQQRLFTHHFVCLLRADHPAVGDRLTAKQFLALEHAVVRAEGRTLEMFEKFLERNRLQRKVVLSTPHFTSIPMIIARSDLVVTVPYPLGKWFSTTSAGLRTVPLPFRIPGVDLRQHWHRRFHESARIRWLRQLVHALFNDETDEWKPQRRA